LLVDLFDRAGFDVTSPRDPARRGGSVVVRTPEFHAVQQELESRDILVDSRPDAGIRVGPHFFNTDDDLRHLVDQMVEIVESGAFERHLAATGGR
jgi:kynureninase